MPQSIPKLVLKAPFHNDAPSNIENSSDFYSNVKRMGGSGMLDCETRPKMIRFVSIAIN